MPLTTGPSFSCKSVLNTLNPYLNHVSLNSDFYGPINAELSKFSGWKYPPLADPYFTSCFPPYELSKNIFNLISLLSISFLTFYILKKRLFDINSYSLIIVGISFPVLSIISRGQVEILIVCMALISLYFYKKDKIFLSANLIAILGFIKVFPLLLAVSFIKSFRKKKFFIYLIISFLILYLLNFILCPLEWRQSFIERITIPWNQMPAGDLKELPNNLGIIKDSMMVRTSDAEIYSIPIFFFWICQSLTINNLFLSGIIGI